MSYCFGRFTLDPEKSQLCSDGVPVPVGSPAIGILLALVEQAGSVVSKDELMSRVWGRSAVGDNLLHVHVHELRKVIGDDCIATKSGRGYRFIAPVERKGPPAPATPPSKKKNGEQVSLRVSGGSIKPPQLIGRDSDLRTISQSLSENRLITLAGPGGVGKTTLALHAAQACQSLFNDGVWLVELASLNDGALVPGTVGTALGVKIGQSAAPLDTLVRKLARKEMLLVLDNCEHLISAVAGLCENLLSTAPGVKVLATSREPLFCSGEKIFKVPPLAFPHDGASLSGVTREMGAIRLFIERVKSVDSGFQLDDEGVAIAARICRRVDGLPLAIEMVSSWVGMLGLNALDAQLDGSLNSVLRAPKSTVPTRHSTLRATLEWSHNLLSPPERIVFRRLAVFASGFTLQAAQAVASDDAVTEEQVFEHVADLVRKSMVATISGSHPQSYRLLETTRSFALEKLTQSADAGPVRQRHARFGLYALERAVGELETTSDAIWKKRYVPILDDLRGALEWAMSQDSDDAVALAGASAPLWRELSLDVEGRRWLSAAKSRLRPDTPIALEARLRNGFGDVWKNSGSVRVAHDELARAAKLYRTLAAPTLLGAALSRLAFALLALGRIQEAEQAIAESLTLLESAGWPRTLANAYSIETCIEVFCGRYDNAHAIGEKTIRLCKTIGAERMAFAASANLMVCSLQMGDVDSAIATGRDLDARLRDTFHSEIYGFVLGVLASALIARRNLDEALATARQAMPLLREEGFSFWLFDHLALRAGVAGRLKDAVRIIGYADVAHVACGRPREPIEERAENRLCELLRSKLPESEIALLRKEGALLTEDQAVALALIA